MDEFKILTAAAESGDIDVSFNYESESPETNLDIKNLLEYCYKTNENENPARCVLIPLEDVFVNYSPKVYRLFMLICMHEVEEKR